MVIVAHTTLMARIDLVGHQTERVDRDASKVGLRQQALRGLRPQARQVVGIRQKGPQRVLIDKDIEDFLVDRQKNQRKLKRDSKIKEVNQVKRKRNWF